MRKYSASPPCRSELLRCVSVRYWWISSIMFMWQKVCLGSGNGPHGLRWDNHCLGAIDTVTVLYGPFSWRRVLALTHPATPSLPHRTGDERHHISLSPWTGHSSGDLMDKCSHNLVVFLGWAFHSFTVNLKSLGSVTWMPLNRTFQSASVIHLGFRM